jgi:hypothetical protein
VMINRNPHNNHLLSLDDSVYRRQIDAYSCKPKEGLVTSFPVLDIDVTDAWIMCGSARLRIVPAWRLRTST